MTEEHPREDGPTEVVETGRGGAGRAAIRRNGDPAPGLADRRRRPVDAARGLALRLVRQRRAPRGGRAVRSLRDLHIPRRRRRTVRAVAGGAGAGTLPRMVQPHRCQDRAGHGRPRAGLRRSAPRWSCPAQFPVPARCSERSPSQSAPSSSPRCGRSRPGPPIAGSRALASSPRSRRSLRARRPRPRPRTPPMRWFGPMSRHRRPVDGSGPIGATRPLGPRRPPPPV